MYVGRLRLAVRTLRRADAALSQAHGLETIPVQVMQSLLLAIRSSRSTHEATPAKMTAVVVGDVGVTVTPLSAEKCRRYFHLAAV